MKKAQLTQKWMKGYLMWKKWGKIRRISKGFKVARNLIESSDKELGFFVFTENMNAIKI